MKKLKLLFFFLIIFIEISLMLILLNEILDKKNTGNLNLNVVNADYTLPKHPSLCLMQSNNTKLINELKPNCSVYFDGTDCKIPTTFIKINSQGFRDREYPIKKSNNTVRIIVLGDSYTFGNGVNISDTYTKVLERKLNSLDTEKYEVFNFGVPGFNTLKEVEFFKEEGVRYDPDIVMLAYLNNDILNNTKY